MRIPEYMIDVTNRMQDQSASIRRDFASHRPTAGNAREGLVLEFLEEHLPKKFEVSTGLLFSSNGELSKQADLVIVDGLNNAPLYGSTLNKFWPVEAVYALIEVKTSLTPTELSDAIEKGRSFKRLSRKFLPSPAQNILDSLFIIWGYECSNLPTLAKNLEDLLKGTPQAEQPDLIIVPDKTVIQSRLFREFTKLGQVGSAYRQQLEKLHGANMHKLLIGQSHVFDYGPNSLMTWYIWLDSWLRHAGIRLMDPIDYASNITGNLIIPESS